MYSVGIKGALVGKHTVRITIGRQEQVEGQPPREIPERVPPQYNRETTLSKDVAPGAQEIDNPRLLLRCRVQQRHCVSDHRRGYQYRLLLLP